MAIQGTPTSNLTPEMVSRLMQLNRWLTGSQGLLCDLSDHSHAHLYTITCHTSHCHAGTIGNLKSNMIS